MKPRILIIGLGNIGSQLAGLLAAMLATRRGSWELVLVDYDHYETANLSTQLMGPEDAGLNKAAAQAERLRRQQPGLSVLAHECRLEELPLGEYQATAVLTCLDSVAARLAARERVWGMGPTWIDTGVSADERLARISVFRPGEDHPCLACSMSDTDYAKIQARHLCRDSASPQATGAPAALGALAASLAALECEKILSGDHDQVAAGKEILISGKWHTHFVSRLKRHPKCRFVHSLLEFETAEGINTDKNSLDTLWSRFAPCRQAALEVRGAAWITSLLCPGCGRSERTLRLRNRSLVADTRCADCGGTLQPSAFDVLEAVASADLLPAQLAQPLGTLGLLPREVISFHTPDGATRNFLLP